MAYAVVILIFSSFEIEMLPSDLLLELKDITFAMYIVIILSKSALLQKSPNPF